METAINERVNRWLDGTYDEETQTAIRRMQANSPEELSDAFYKDLEFGTGGLRGIMGVGTNRMNKYTVAMATQGLANYLKQQFSTEVQKVVIAYDSRNNSAYFSEITADVLSANGVKVYVFDTITPTPELSFAIRHLHCHSGIVITASHNPKEYNGYKVMQTAQLYASRPSHHSGSEENYSFRRSSFLTQFIKLFIFIIII